ncbi:hypothetical protein NQ317_018092 [Molorchus minor]|uniref:Transposase n=1 Tax=Molorchus minor TaxID=1323400 RepID=A0ABQ9JDV8_9CUCU|nr:hypothetical protein NQ317_018092 [Molorchus minor]
MEHEVKEVLSKKPIILQNLVIQPAAEIGVSQGVPTGQTSSVGVQTSRLFSRSTEELRLLKAENSKLKAQLAQEKTKKWSSHKFEEICNEFLSPELSSLVKMQIQLAGSGEKGQRYSNAFKQFCLTLYFLGPKSYRYLKKICKLPSVRSLQRFVEIIKFKPGVNDMLFEILKFKVTNMNAKDKICYISVDEMALKKHLFYNYTLDEIVGVEDNGTERTCFVPATSAAVFMLTGINSKWKQPIGYALSATSLKAVDVKKILDQFIDKVTSIGLDVVALVTDMGSNFIHLSNMLGVTSENSLVYLGKKQILYYFDPCHLIKAARNNLMTATFKWEEFTASWKDVEMYFAKDRQALNRMAPKLTQTHLSPTNFQKMKVSLAVQVLSNTVASAIETYIHFDQLPSEAAGTAQFLRKFDKLFNIFNSLSKNPTSKLDYAFQGDQTQLEFLHNAKSFFRKYKSIQQQK